MLLVFFLIFAIVPLIGMWKVFTKAGEPGWAAIIPFYNTYVILKIGDNPGWWLVLLLIPLVNIYFAYRMLADLARGFGKSGAYGLGLMFLPFVFFPLLGFGSAQYRGVGGRGGRRGAGA